MKTVALGPLTYRVEGPVPPELEAFVQITSADNEDGVPCVAPHDLADRVVRDAPGAGAIVLHAAGVTVEGGVVALVAPPGTGKTTAALHAGGRAFAYNAMLVRVIDGPDGRRPMAWSLPFAGGQSPPPPLRDVTPRELLAVLRLVRGDAPKLEWRGGAGATTTLLPACLWPRQGDTLGQQRAVVALDIASRVRVGTIVVPMSPDWLDTLDAEVKGR